MIAYKVITKVDTRLLSAFIGVMDSAVATKYLENEWIHAKENSYLFVFQTLKQAQDWSLTFLWGDEIWECEVEGVSEKFKLYRSNYGSLLEYLKGELDENELVEIDPPEGTLAVKSVKLLKKVFRPKHEHY